MGSFLDRYRAGEEGQVWAELERLGDQVATPTRRGQAWAVACETMRRARKNIETIFGRLKEASYEFDQPEWAWNPSTADDVECVRVIESLVGPMPLSLRAWYEIVGSVWWTGSHPDWKELDPCTDALVVTPVSHILDEAQEWLEDRHERYEEYGERFHVELSPDKLHKANISGGAPYSIACGTPCADGLVKEESRRISFVPYVRVCFSNGGFPGFEGYAASERDSVLRLSRGLLSI